VSVAGAKFLTKQPALAQNEARRGGRRERLDSKRGGARERTFAAPFSASEMNL
jgi:hypothetical protein